MAGLPLGPRSLLDAANGLIRPSLQHRVVVEVLKRRKGADIADPVAFRERFLATEARHGKVPSDFGHSTLSAPGLPVLEHVPAGASGRTLVYVHGGSYCRPEDPHHFDFTRRLAREVGAKVLMPLYPLAPEHTWRDSRDALIDLVAGLADGPGELVLSGDSAGGGYALSVAQGIRDAGRTLPGRMVLIAPWINLTDEQVGRSEAARTDPWLNEHNMHVYATWWAGTDADRRLPEASPLLGDLTGLPPTLSICGTRDLLYPENRDLAELAEDAGWDFTFVEGEGLVHVYPLLPVPEARAALRRIVAFIED